MFKNYLTIAIRNIKRQKLYSIINILGLAVGMACCFLILLFVLDELSYDQFHTHAHRIYRLEANIQGKNYVRNQTHVPLSFAKSLTESFPEIQQTTRIHKLRERPMVIHGDNAFFEERIYYADKTIFEVFSFPLLQGNPKTALEGLGNIVLTQSTAQKYFPNQNPIGNTLRFDTGFVSRNQTYLVTGVVQDAPSNSHFKFDFLIPFAKLEQDKLGSSLMHTTQSHTYVLLHPDASQAQLTLKLPNFVDHHDATKLQRERLGHNNNYELFFRPITDIHLANLVRDLEPGRDSSDLYLFMGIGLLILLVACINYINLSTARSERRAKEVGVRKLVGAHRKALIRQFFIESFLMASIAFFLALAITELSLPWFATITNKTLNLSVTMRGMLIMSFASIVLCVGFISGIYPAFFLSAFQSVEVLKGSYKIGNAASIFRKGLVVTQFVISTGFILITIVMYSQLEFVKNKRLGFDQSQILIITSLSSRPTSMKKVSPQNSQMKIQSVLNFDDHSFKQELLRNPRIMSVTGSSLLLGSNIYRGGSYYLSDQPDKDPITSSHIFVDPKFITTFGIQLVDGRNFNAEFGSEENVVIVNETFLKQAGWNTATDKIIEQRSTSTMTTVFRSPNGKVTEKFEKRVTKEKYHIIGVVADFHFRSLHKAISPLVLRLPNKDDGALRYVSIKIHSEDIPNTLTFIENTWKRFGADLPFEFTFLDEEFDQLYRSETQWMHTIGLFALLAVFIGCLGVFGLAAFSAEQRTKEIGIRKVMGASIQNILVLLSKDFIKLILIANIVAWPIAYWIINNWLVNFAYRINLSWHLFALSGGIAFIIALSIVGYQALKAARANPIDALRYE